MTTYERCIKANVKLNPTTLNIQLQEGRGMQGREGEDWMMNTRKAPSGCGERYEKGANRPKEGEGTG
jgi:hypothetical protein